MPTRPSSSSTFSRSSTEEFAPEATPVFTGIYDGESLSCVIALQFQRSPQKAEAAIEAARREVAL